MEKDIFSLIKNLKSQNFSEDEIKLILEREFSSNLMKKHAPITGNFELTPKCCLDCKMCFVHLNKKQIAGRKELTTEQWLKIMGDAINSGMLAAGITGGECLLRPDFKELYLFLLNNGIKVTVLTNAVLLNDKWLEFFKNNPPYKFMISLYGSNDDIYEKVTGKRLGTIVKNNIEKLVPLYKKGLFDLSISVTANIYMENDLLNIVKYLSKLQVPYNVSPVLMEPNEDTERTCKDLNINIEEYIECLKWQKKNENKKMYFSSVYNQESCYINNFEIGWNGIMIPSIFHHLVSANVLELGFNKAWDIINTAITEYKTPERCLNCCYGGVCVCPKQPSAYAIDKDGKRTACNHYAMNLMIRLDEEGFFKSE